MAYTSKIKPRYLWGLPILIILVAAIISALEMKPRVDVGTEINGSETVINNIVAGIDVSRHQNDIDWNKFYEYNKDSISFVYVKATEGATYVDPCYRRNIEGARKVGFKVGAYHYFRTTSSAIDQFRNFQENVKKEDIDLIPVVDVEECDHLSINELKKELKQFIDSLEKAYESPVMIYGTQRSYNSFCVPEFNDYKLMIGRYGKNEPQIKGCGEYTIWQFTEKGEFQGIPKPVDIDILNRNKSIDDILIPQHTNSK